MNIHQSGRSMVEMIGVLAIVGVLSVGAIAGYSKAMQKWKVNKTLNEISVLVFGIVEHLDGLKKVKSTGSYTPLGDMAKKLQIIPNNWKQLSNYQFRDGANNFIQVFKEGDRIALDLYLGNVSHSINGQVVGNKFSPAMCLEFVQKIALSVHASVQQIQGYGFYGTLFYGDEACDGKTKKCVNQVTSEEILEFCNSCPKSNSGACAVVLDF